MTRTVFPVSLFNSWDGSTRWTKNEALPPLPFLLFVSLPINVLHDDSIRHTFLGFGFFFNLSFLRFSFSYIPTLNLLLSSISSIFFRFLTLFYLENSLFYRVRFRLRSSILHIFKGYEVVPISTFGLYSTFSTLTCLHLGGPLVRGEVGSQRNGTYSRSCRGRNMNQCRNY